MRESWALGIVFLLVGCPVRAESLADKEPVIRPAVEVGGAYYAYLPLSIGEFDRTMWLTHVAAVARLPMGFSAAARYDLGGIIYGRSGHVFRHGPGLATRYAPFGTRWCWIFEAPGRESVNDTRPWCGRPMAPQRDEARIT